ncbi:hypothetical protein [Novipirellula artificiosorum]|nr:hypothetical protein [Novipirellula artificiosorum]
MLQILDASWPQTQRRRIVGTSKLLCMITVAAILAANLSSSRETHAAEPQANETTTDPIGHRNTFSIAGRVVDEAGTGLAGIELRLIVADQRPSPRNRFPFNWQMIESGRPDKRGLVRQLLLGKTDLDGRFVFNQVQPGKDIELAYWGQDVARGRQTSLEDLSPNERRNLIVQTVAGGTIHGKFDPALYLIDELTLSGIDGTFRPQSTDNSTRYEFTGIPAGVYKLRILCVEVNEKTDAAAFMTSQMEYTIPLVVKSGATLTVELDGNAPSPVTEVTAAVAPKAEQAE